MGGNSLLEIKTGGGSASPAIRPCPLHLRCGARVPGPAAWLLCWWRRDVDKVPSRGTKADYIFMSLPTRVQISKRKVNGICLERLLQPVGNRQW